MSFDSLMTEWDARKRDARKALFYLECRRTGRNVSPMVPPRMRSQMFTRIPWADLVTKALEERCTLIDVKAGTASLTKSIRELWKDADGYLVFSQARQEALGYGRSYVSVTTSSTGKPLMTMLTARSTVHTLDPETGDMTEALRVYGPQDSLAAHYELGRTTFLARNDDGKWRTLRVDEHQADELAIVLVCPRSTAVDGYGLPEAKSVWTLQDAATRCATDAATAGALMAVPQRAILGVKEEELTESTEELYMARMLTLSEPAARIEQLTAAQLQQFATLMNMFARQASSITGLPVTLFGVNSEANPVSGDSIRQDDSRVDRRAGRLMQDFTPAAEKILRLLARFAPDSQLTAKALAGLSVVWAGGNPPGKTEQADIAVKLSGAKHGDQPMFSRRFVLTQMGLKDEEITAELDAVESSILDTLLREGEELEGQIVDPQGTPSSE